MMTHSVPQKVHRNIYGHNKACKREIKGNQNKPQICGLKRTIIFWIYPFLERETKSIRVICCWLDNKKKPNHETSTQFYIVVVVHNTHKHTHRSWFLLNSSYISESYNVIHTNIKTFIVKIVDSTIHIYNEKCINFVRNVNYAHKNTLSFKGFIASNRVQMLHTLRK